jgi:hypothetical protein
MTQRTGQAAGESLTALLAGGAAEHPALIVPDSGEVLTYGQAAARVEALAQRLAGLGVPPTPRPSTSSSWPISPPG